MPHLDIPGAVALPSGIVSDQLLVERVLYEAEMPVLFLSKTIQGQALLAYVADDTHGRVSTLLSPIARARLEALETGALSVCEALASSCMWLHVSERDGGGLWAVNYEQIPEGYLPIAGTLLLPEHEPALRTRAIGADVVLGKMPASVVAFVADSTRRAIKALLHHTFDSPSDGRPRKEHQALYDLPVQSFAFASFELGFAAPDEGLFPQEQVRKAAVLLEKGLLFASGRTPQIPDYADDAERDAILSAALLLTPPASGPITEVQISGRWMPHGKIRLDRASRKRVRDQLRIVDERVVTYTGRIGELDSDNLTFILRDTSDGDDRRGSFEEDLLDDMHTFFQEHAIVVIAGLERRGRLRVMAIANTSSE
jgi:hypothetical protein